MKSPRIAVFTFPEPHILKFSNPASPGGCIKADHDVCAPFDDRALDGAGLGHHQLPGAGGIVHGGLRAGVQLAPGRAFAVDQRLPASGLSPQRQFLRGNALFFEIVEPVVQALVGEPGAGFFDRVAIVIRSAPLAEYPKTRSLLA